MAIRRLVIRLALRDFGEDVMILHFGRDKSHLTVLWGRRLILYREIEFGENRAIEQVAKSLELPLDSAAALLLEFGVFPETASPYLDRASVEISETVMEILTPGFANIAEQIGNALIYTASRTRGESVEPHLSGWRCRALARRGQVDQLVDSHPGADPGSPAGDNEHPECISCQCERREPEHRTGGQSRAAGVR